MRLQSSFNLCKNFLVNKFEDEVLRCITLHHHNTPLVTKINKKGIIKKIFSSPSQVLLFTQGSISKTHTLHKKFWNSLMWVHKERSPKLFWNMQSSNKCCITKLYFFLWKTLYFYIFRNYIPIFADNWAKFWDILKYRPYLKNCFHPVTQRLKLTTTYKILIQ